MFIFVCGLYPGRKRKRAKVIYVRSSRYDGFFFSEKVYGGLFCVVLCGKISCEKVLKTLGELVVGSRFVLEKSESFWKD